MNGLSERLQAFLREKVVCQLATLMPDGSPQITTNWVDTDGTQVLINTAEGRQKVRNVRRDPRVAVSVLDPADIYRRVHLRGRVTEVTLVGADDHADFLAQKYLGQPKYSKNSPDEVRVLLKITVDSLNSAKVEAA